MRFEAENETNIELSVVVANHKEEDIVHGTKEKCRKVKIGYKKGYKKYASLWHERACPSQPCC